MGKRHSLRLCLFFLAILFFSITTHARTDEDMKSWNTAIVTGTVSTNPKVKYYFQPQANFTDNHYKLQSVFAFLGAGYQVFPEVTVWLLNGWFTTKHNNGDLLHRDIIREQIDWTIFQNDEIAWQSQTRVEQRKEISQSQWALRIREKMTLRLPFKNWKNHSLVLFDEVFFDLNHPKWINTNTFLQQNRAFIGIGTQFTKAVSLDAGYVNQYQFRKTNRMSNVLFLTLHVVAD